MSKVLLIDIGGTNLRYAYSESNSYEESNIPKPRVGKTPPRAARCDKSCMNSLLFINTGVLRRAQKVET